MKVSTLGRVGVVLVLTGFLSACLRPTPATVTAGEETVVETSTTTGVTPQQGVDVEIEELIGITEDVRGLDFLEPPTVVIVTADELERRVREDLVEELEDISTDQAVFRLLGLIEAGTDLGELYLDLYGEQVAGFYDGDTKELVVPTHPTGLSGLQRSTLVHELTHALTDQHFGMWEAYQNLLDAELYDEATAMLSIIEGDAVLSEVLYIQTLPADRQEEIISESLGVDSTSLDAAPSFIRQGLVFPYTTGFDFVLERYLREKTEARDALYSSPPASTEQVMDGAADEPQTVTIPSVQVDGYQVESDGSWGALSWKLMFDQVIAGDEVAVIGWGGDRAVVLSNGDDVVLIIVYRGDEPADAEEMHDALVEYFGIVYGEPVSDDLFQTDQGWVRLARSGSGVTVVVADDPRVGETVFESLTS